MKKAFLILSIFAFLMGLVLPAAAADIPSEVTLIKNVNIFDGQNEELLVGYDVLVVKNLIKKIDKNIKLASTYEINVKTGGYKEMAGGVLSDLPEHENQAVMVYEPEKMIKKEVKVRVIDGKGHTLIPGLTDVHWHMTMAEVPQATILTGDVYEIAARAVPTAERTLMRGFTTVRDIGGNSFSLKKLIDADVIIGPRMLVAGAPLSQTGGHYDYRIPHDVPADSSLDYWGRVGFFLIADGVPEVRKRARELFRAGASQIKIAGGGGVASIFDPLDVRQYSLEEMKAIVDVADSYNSYVAAHIFTDDAVQMAVKAGIKTIEHGMLIHRETLEMMKEKGVWLSIQPILDDEDRMVFPSAASNAKFKMATDGTDNVYRLAKEIGVKIAFGTDCLMDPVAAQKQGKLLSKLKRWFTPYEALKMATSDNAELMEMSGPRHPYREGPLGVIKAGAYADLILVDGNPLQNLDLVADADKNFVVIMKDGKIYKNTIQ